MVVTSKAYPEDWPKAEQLFKKHANSDDTNYKLLFKKYWETDEKHIGYFLLNDNQVVGFLGCVFSKRRINNNIFKFCGLSSWVVNPEFRSSSIFLLMEVLKLKEYAITSFTSIPDAIKILTKLGFKVLDEANRYIPNRINFFNNSFAINYFTKEEEFVQKLNEEDLRIFHNHKQFHAKHLLFLNKEEYCYIIIKEHRIYNRNLYNSRVVYLYNRLTQLYSKTAFIHTQATTAQIHYISNRHFFNKNIKAISNVICKKYKLDGIIVENRFLKKSFGLIKFKTMPRISLYKSKNIKPENIDSLFSELFILN